jgi:hypothetical protein
VAIGPLNASNFDTCQIEFIMSAPVLGGIELVLEDTLVAYIANWIQDDQFKIKLTADDPSYANAGGETRGAAAVHAGMLPKNEVGDILVDSIPVFPFVLCHITNGKDMMPEGCVYTKVVVGVWDNNADYQGYRDALYLIRKIVRKIWYWNTLSDTYQVNMDEGTTWRIYDTNVVTFPFFFAEAIIGWRMRTPYMRAERDDLDVDIDSDILAGQLASAYPTRSQLEK